MQNQFSNIFNISWIIITALAVPSFCRKERKGPQKKTLFLQLKYQEQKENKFHYSPKGSCQSNKFFCCEVWKKSKFGQTAKSTSNKTFNVILC